MMTKQSSSVCEENVKEKGKTEEEEEDKEEEDIA